MNFRPYLVLLPSEPLFIAPSYFVHRVRVSQIRRTFVELARRHRVPLHPPTMAKAVGELIHRQYKLALGRSSFLSAGAECIGLHVG